MIEKRFSKTIFYVQYGYQYVYPKRTFGCHVHIRGDKTSYQYGGALMGSFFSEEFMDTNSFKWSFSKKQLKSEKEALNGKERVI
jgi:hypothetical protein